MPDSELREKVARLEAELAAARIQRRLMETFVSGASSGEDRELLDTLLQTTLDAASDLCGAEKGSLFLLDESGAVMDSILTRREASADQRKRLIGTVFDKGLAGWVNRHHKVGLIRDTRRDDRWLTLPNQPYSVLSALAVPVLSRRSGLLAILILLHSEENRFDGRTAELMQATAYQIAVVLENVHLYTRLEETLERAEAYSKALDRELDKGRKIQQDFLPDHIPQPDGWSVAAFFQPALQVSGDFYDAFTLPGGYLGLVIADVCDKGVGSALFMALFRSLIRIYSGHLLPDTAATGWSPAQALEAVPLTNDYIAETHGEEGMFATLFFGVLDPRTGTLDHINAGHEPPFLLRNDGGIVPIRAGGPSVGIMPDVPYRKERVTLGPGDMLLGYTDGVSEALDTGENLFTKHRLEGILRERSGGTDAAELIESIMQQLRNHMEGASQADDITMIAVLCRGIAIS
jgi:sigma-B regulation protein RsbU (phosphoserine phosphatase)